MLYEVITGVFVPRGHDNPLGARKAQKGAGIEKALYLFGDAPHGLNVAQLVEAAGDGQVLAEGDAGDRGKEGVEFRARGRVAVYLGVGLLEANARRQRQGKVAGVFAVEETLDDKVGLVVDLAGEARFALDIDDALVSGLV